jgi:hypothetical protein
MSLDAIRDKLEAILRKSPKSEAELVYVMVEMRKFLEREGQIKETQFSTLKFFCDWVLHPVLEYSGAKNVLKRLDPEIGVSGPIDPHNVKPSSELFQMMSLGPLLAEIKSFCVENNLPKHWTSDPIAWRECMRIYGHVVLDCPLAINRKDAPSRYIKRLTLRNAVDSQEHTDKRSFSWDWCFELSDGNSFVLHHEFAYPAPSYDNSHPTPTEFGI